MKYLRALVLVLLPIAVSSGCGPGTEHRDSFGDRPASSETEDGKVPADTDSTPEMDFVNISTPTPEYEKTIEFPHLTLQICEDGGNRYSIKRKGNAVSVYAENPYEDFDGVTLCFDEDLVRSLTVRVRYNIGFLQYLFDDKPAPYLDYSVETDWSDLPVRNGSILNPQHYHNVDGVRTVYEQLGFSSYEAFSDSIESKHFEFVHKESIELQREFYTFKLKTYRKNFEECCPEYIEQAEAFLKKDPEDLKSFSELGVDPFISRTLIEIEGETKVGEKFTYYIAEADYWFRSS